MSPDSIGGLITVVLLGGILLRGLLPILWNKETVAKLTLKNGREYTYVMGDYMRSYNKGGTFNGIDVALPKELPHIYLDTLKGAGRRSQFIIAPSQSIQLEGNFNKTYRVFVPKKYQVLALSLLSPDVMATLEDFATGYDIELYGSHARVITNKRIMPNRQRQDAVLAIALQLMREVDERLQSWSKADSLDAVNQELLLYPHAGFRLFGHSFMYVSALMVIYWALVTFGFGLAGLLTIIYPGFRPLGFFFLGLSLVLFVGFFVFGARQDRKARFRSRH